MVSASKLLHLTEAFSQPWFLLAAPNNYQLVLFLLEIFNNMIQYQFDGRFLAWSYASLSRFPFSEFINVAPALGESSNVSL